MATIETIWVKTVRVRPARTAVCQEHGVINERGMVELSIYGTLTAIISVADDKPMMRWISGRVTVSAHRLRKFAEAYRALIA